MRTGSRGRRGLTGLVSLLVVYGIITAVILSFARQFLSDISEGTPFQIFFLLPLGVILPLALFVVVILSLVRLVRDLRARKPGARFKKRLVGFFILVVVLSSFPQSVLSLGFITSTMNAWFSRDMEEALTGGVDVALHYYQETLDALDLFSRGEVLETLLQNYHYQPERLWETVSQAHPQVDALQLYDGQGALRGFFGDPDAERTEPIETDRTTGILPKEDSRDISLLRAQVNYTLGQDNYSALLTVVLPAHFDDKARNLTRALEAFTQYRILQGTFFSTLILFYLIFSFPLLLLSLLVSFILSDEVIEPVVSLEVATRRVAEGDYSFRILSRSGDELSLLIESFNQMVSELDRSRKMILQTEKIAAWQEIAQRLAHEIKNPLTPIKLSAQRILRRFETDPEGLGKILPAAVDSIVAEVDNLTILLQEFRDFSRLPSPTLRPVNLSQLVEEVLQTYADHYPLVRVDREDLQETLVLPLDREQMKRVFSNLFKNAFEAIEGAGEITLRTDLVRKGNTSYSRVRIEDTGKGIPAEDQNQVFNPYFTTKRGGTGLGLPIVERIIFDHHGQIWFESQSGTGTTFYIDLPLGEDG